MKNGKRCLAAFVLWATVLISPVRSLQAAALSTLYIVMETQAEWRLVAMSSDSTNVDTLAAWPKWERINLNTPFPAEELALMKARQDEIIREWRQPTLTPAQEQVRTVQTSVRSMSVSLSGSRIAVAIQRQICLFREFDDCFGVSQVALIDPTTREMRVIGELSIRADASRLLRPGCAQTLDITSDNVIVTQLQWLPNEQSLIASMGTDGRCIYPEGNINVPLVRFAADGASAPQKVADAAAFTISPDSQLLVTFSRERGAMNHWAGVFAQIDVNSGQVLHTTQHNFGAYETVFGTLAYINGTSVTIYGYMRRDQNQAFNYLLERAGQTIVVPTPANLPIDIQQSADATIAFAQRQDKTLWQVTIQDNQVHLSPVFLEPVRAWQPGSGNTLLIQKEGSTTYTVIDARGAVLHAEIDVSAALRRNDALQSGYSVQIHSVAW